MWVYQSNMQRLESPSATSFNDSPSVCHFWMSVQPFGNRQTPSWSSRSQDTQAKRMGGRRLTSARFGFAFDERLVIRLPRLSQLHHQTLRWVKQLESTRRSIRQSELDKIGFNRISAYKALNQLRDAGLIRLHRRRRNSPIVQILDPPE